MVNTISSYTNFFGEDVSTATLLSDMIADLQSRVQRGESSLTDVNIGSETRNLFESMSTAILRLLQENDAIGRMQSTRLATGGYLDDRGYENGLTRKNGNQANGTVTFKISTPLPIDYTIYAGTRILNSKNGLRYILDEDVTIEAGSTWNTGLVYGEGVGEEYNCPAHVLTAFDTEQYLRGDLEVDNDYAFENGFATESDDDFRSRILASQRGGSFGSWDYYRRICENVTGVHDVHFVMPTTLNAIAPKRHTVINSKNETIECNSCTAVCVVNYDNDVSNTNPVLREVTELLTNQYNIVLGHEFHVQNARKQNYYFSIDYYGENGINVTESDVVDCLETLIYGGTYDGVQSIYYEGFKVASVIPKYVFIDALENMVGIHHVESIKLMMWHKSNTSINKLTKWINNNKIYGATAEKPFVYSSILDFPDDDDPQYIKYGGTSLVPAWKKIGTNEYNEDIFLLVLDGYYFYKIKDNQVQHDNNEGEHGIEGELDYFGWGELTFDNITLKADCAMKLGSLHNRDEENTHIIRLNKLN